jgi:hypothetical protein
MVGPPRAAGEGFGLAAAGPATGRADSFKGVTARSGLGFNIQEFKIQEK